MARRSAAAPRIVVVGAGLAGLVTCRVLAGAGVHATLFEASDRIGGRVRTHDGDAAFAPRVELGGEFIDSSHHDMLALVQCAGLTLVDTASAAENTLQTTYHFGGQHYSEAQVLTAYRAVAPRIAADARRLSPSPSAARHTAHDRRLDDLSLAEYLDRLEMEPWLRALLRVAYETEYGLDAGEQSSLNLVSLIGTDSARGFELYGDSDERFKVREGMEGITRWLAAGLGPRIRLRHRLVRVRERAHGGYRLDFDTGPSVRRVDADIVVFSLPFTLLRQVDLQGLLPPSKQHCVDTLGYGHNAKLIMGLSSRPWRAQGRDGTLYTDLPMQSGWDASRQSLGDAGAYTWFMGGQPALDMGRGAAAAHAQRFVKGMDRAFADFAAHDTGDVLRVHWPTEPFALGSYTCYRPGQWTRLAGLEGRRVRHLHFAGEHCSCEFQGYMNGAAETGRRAAAAILEGLA